MKKLFRKLLGLGMFVAGLLLFFIFLQNLVKGVGTAFSSESFFQSADGVSSIAFSAVIGFVVFVLMKTGNRFYHI